MRFFSSLLKNKLPLFLFSVLLYALSFPGLVFREGIPLLIFFAYIPVFALIRRSSLRFSSLIGFFYGALLFSLLCFWLESYGFFVLMLVSCYIGFLYSVLFFLLKSASFAVRKGVWLYRVAIVVSFEFLRSVGFLGFPYGCAGYALWKIAPFVRLASFFGVHGISFLIIFFSSVVEHFVLEERFVSGKKNCAFLAAFFVFVFGGMILTGSGADGEKDGIVVCAVQPAFTSSKLGVAAFFEEFSRLRQLTDSAFEENPDIDIVVWPETAIVPDIGFYLENDYDSERHRLAQEVLAYAQEKKAVFVIGNNHRENTGGTERRFNSALVLSEQGGKVKISSYNKVHLVPFAEKIPFKTGPNPSLKKLASMLASVLYSDDYDSGDDLTLFPCGKLLFGVPICFEDAFPEISGGMRRLGADFLLNISDDSWSGSEACQNQHLAMSVFRAAENGIPVVRSTADGKTCFIDRFGKIRGVLPSFEGGWLTQKISTGGTSRTFCLLFARNATLILVSGTLISLLLIFARFVRIKLWQMKSRKRI